MQLLKAKAEDIIVPEDRVRKSFDKKSLKKLAESFTRLGMQIQPGVCKKEGDKFVLIAGERRLRAAIMAKTDYLFVLLEEADEVLLLEIEIEENLQRDDLTWDEKVFAKERLHLLREKQKEKLGKKQTLRATAEELEESLGSTAETMELAIFAREFHEVRGAKNITEAKKVVKKLKGMVVRAKLLGKATDLAGKSLILTETNNAPEIKVKGFSITPEKMLDYDDRIIYGKMEEKLSTFKDESIKIVLFDPPWGVNFNSVKKENSSQEDYEDSEDILEEFEGWLDLLYKKMHKDSHLYMFFGIVNYEKVYSTLRKVGFACNGLPIYWVKQGSHRVRNPKIWPGRAVEPIAFARKGSKDIVKQGAPDFIITPNLPPKIKDIHPSAKHPDIYLELLKRSTLPGDTVLDPMCGSGMVGVAADVLKTTHKLDWFLIEKELPFRELALENCLTGYSQLLNPSAADNSLTRTLDFQAFTPGSTEWKEYWKTNPDKQKEMTEWAGKKG